METIDFGIDWKNFFAVGLYGSLEDFSSETLHVHPFHQVLHIKSGVALLQDARGTSPQYGHMAAFIPARIPHRTTVVGDSLVYQSLYFRESLLEWHGRTVLLFRMSPLGMALLDRINEEEPLRNLGEGLAKDCVDLFLKVLASDLKNESSFLILPEAKTPVGRKVCTFLSENYAGKITSDHISRAASCSFRQISRIFKTDTGLSVFDYLRTFRMLQASIAISMTDKKILAVAYDCGYDSVSSFFSDFCRYFGRSPAEFRHHHRR